MPRDSPRPGKQSGQAIVLIALMLTVLIGMVAVAIDGSRAYALRREMQDATDAAALAAADKLQQSGSYVTAEQAATTVFARNLSLYGSPSCTGYGTPGAAPWTVTCTYSDGTVLTDVARDLGPQGSRFQMTATRTLQLQFGRVLTNGTNPNLGTTSSGSVNNLLYSPALAALNQSGCGGSAGNAIVVNGSGSLSVNGDVVANGSVSMVAGSMRVVGDIYARCQSPVPGPVATVCYPSGANPACTYPDVAGVTRAGNQLADPIYPVPSPLGSSQSTPANNVVLMPGTYAAPVVLLNSRCWFLAGGIYTFSAGAVNASDFLSNELKPPDEPVAGDNTQRAAAQFWDTDGVRCAGAAQVTIVGGPRGIPVGNWAFLLTSVRSDTYGGVTYARESAPSMCYAQNVNNSGQNVQISVSNVPGATAYNIYASPPSAGGTCTGNFGFVTSMPVTAAVQNNVTAPCPVPFGGGCSLGNETIRLDSNQIGAPFAPNATALPGTSGAYPPDGERAALAAGLPNQNPSEDSGAAGDRANENDCRSLAGSFISCPGPITPGAVELYFPAGGCLTTGNGSDNYLFSGYQYNWISVHEPGTGSPPANTCSNTLGAQGNSAWIGLVYAPAATISVISPYIAEAAGVGGMMAAAMSFTGNLPSITYSAMYAPIPPASRLTN